MAEEPFIGVGVTVLDAEVTIARCLDSLLGLDYPDDRYEVVVVDALSTDRTPDVLREYASRTEGRPRIRLLSKAGTIGAGRNEGIRHSRRECIGVTDGDAIVDPRWLLGVYRGEAITEVGGDAEELLTAEDPELNHRLHLAGWKAAYDPEAVVYHVHRTGCATSTRG